ncbi:GGDEF domain-containing protein [Aliivibrio sifiae]|uniref:diguanylate cyclase n=1 Tax=Aliivibrio sifiae TaxID=566293 RepID=A0A2S7X735_9GAMM|nr:GGDEF domain-containing protein [Aliivibrio sifiae]PQJ87150.1 GGDEF domain-containing protein [Aliivibrio sifiae]GLR73714.1 GGDEF domain-containing protein [Aliivibrio sifiae]
MTESNVPVIATGISASLLATIIAASHYVGFDSISDVFFEGTTLILLGYMFLTLKTHLIPYSKIMIGAYLLLFNKFYDLLTEVPFIENYSDKYEVIDTLLDDGTLLVAFFLIAVGVTAIVKSIIREGMKDDLTRLYNRKKFPEIKLPSFDLIYFDLNGLKQVNDIKGHAVGDLMIIRFAQALKEHCLREEMAFRVGGDEFIVTVEPERAITYINSVHASLLNESISFSYGIEKATKENFDEALIRSDKAMYTMKKAQKKSTSSAQILYR